MKKIFKIFIIFIFFIFFEIIVKKVNILSLKKSDLTVRYLFFYVFHIIYKRY